MLALALMVLAAEPVASDPDDAFLSQARVMALGQDFEKCLKRLEQANRKGVSNQRLSEIDLYLGVCQFGLGNEKGALAAWELALRLNPKAQLPSMQSPKVRELFEKLRAQVPQPIDEKPPDEPKDKVPPPPEPGSCRAATDCSALELCVNDHCVTAPPPMPAPERHLTGPLVVGVIGLASLGGGVTFGFLAKDSETQAHAAHFASDAALIADRASTQSLVANICYGVAAAALITALIIYLVTN